MKNNKITVLKSIIYDTTRLKAKNNKVSVAKLIYIYLFNLRLANSRKLPSKRKISQSLNIDYRSVQANLNLLISSGFLSIENEIFEIYYEGQIIKELKKEARNASKVYLATDPDREGEAISWHLAFFQKREIEETIFIQIIAVIISKPRKALFSAINFQRMRKYII